MSVIPIHIGGKWGRKELLGDRPRGRERKVWKTQIEKGEKKEQRGREGEIKGGAGENGEKKGLGKRVGETPGPQTVHLFNVSASL